MTPRRSSGSRRADEGVDPTRSQNMMVSEQLAPVAYRRHADVLEIIGCQFREHGRIDFVLKEGGRVSLETQVAQPRRYVHQRTLFYSTFALILVQIGDERQIVIRKLGSCTKGRFLGRAGRRDDACASCRCGLFARGFARLRHQFPVLEKHRWGSCSPRNSRSVGSDTLSALRSRQGITPRATG